MGLKLRTVVPALAAVSAIVLTVSLGNWQLRRAAEKAAMQSQIDAANRAAPVELGASAVDAAALEGLRIAASGRFEPEHTLLIDNRTHRGVAGFHVITPLRVDGTELRVLVLRGWVARDRADRNRLPPLTTPAGQVRIEGLAQQRLPQAMQLAAEPAPGPSDRIWQQFDVAKFQRWSGLRTQDLILRQTSALDDGLVREWTLPGSSVDKHRAYAWQWFAMAAGVAVLWAWYAWRGRRPNAIGAGTGQP